jgi:nicotinamide-nucleotide amidase
MTIETTLSTPAQAAATALRETNATVAVAESATGGLISASLLSIPGASTYFLAGATVYTYASRNEFLDLHRDDVAHLQPMTEAMAAHFAETVRAKFDADWGVAELGVAGPGGVPYNGGIDPGTSVIAVAGPRTASTTTRTGSNDREANMWAFARGALGLLHKTVVSFTAYGAPPMP